MQNYLKKYFVGCLLFFLTIIIAGSFNSYISKGPIIKMTAAVFNPTNLPNSADPASGFAWNDNAGWINFGTTTSSVDGRVYISNDRLYGYAWGENIGWISMNCANTEADNCSTYGVTQSDSDGTLTGKAWGENVGWIDFAPTNGGVFVSTSTSGTNTLTGYAWGENIGWISFNCSNTNTCGTSNYKVSTTWTYPTFTLSYATSTIGGTISGSSTQIIPKGENGSEVEAIPDTGYHFVSWSDNSTSTTRTDTNITVNKNLTASFAINTYTLTYIASSTPDAGSSITGSSTQVVNYGENGTAVTATPSTGYEFEKWSDDSVQNPRTDTNVTGDLTLTAIFKKKSGGGIPTPACVYDDPAWSSCVGTSTQSRTLNATNQSCLGEDPKVETRNCELIVTINPSTSTVLVGDKIQFAATVTGSANTAVNWVVFPIDANNYYGAITNTGLYTAPESINTLTSLKLKVIVTSQADASKKATAEITVNSRPACTGYTYTNWGACVGGLQTRIASTSIPTGCSGGLIATTSQACAMATSTATTTATTTMTACTDYTYSDWSECINNKQTRTTLSSIPSNCIGGKTQITEQSCKMEAVMITPDSAPMVLDKNGNLIPASAENNSNGNKTARGNSGHSSSKNKTGIAVVDNIVSALDVSSLVTNNVAVLGTTTERIVLGAQKVLESPAGATVAKTITTAGVVGGGVAATGVLAMNGTAVADLLFLPFKLWGLLLSALGLKKRNRPWGTVYDSVTKQPIDPAYVTITNLKTKKDETSITDLDGRYGFLVGPGKYTLTANKTNYTFPSKKLAGKANDVLYGNLYFGEEITTPVTGAVVSKNIPLDPVKFDWNEFTKGKKKMMKFYSKREKIMRIVTDWIFRIGFGVSLISLFLVSAPYNLIIFGLYLVLYATRKIGLKQKSAGSLTDKEGNPLSFAIIRVFDAELNVQIVSKVANQIGKYYCLVNKGKYYIKIEKKNDDESYTEVFTSPAFEAENGIINKSFII